tara:strand:+ start:223 stop:807 length:585 start_codon:yes stop_codon:yes gene_type:complete
MSNEYIRGLGENRGVHGRRAPRLLRRKTKNPEAHRFKGENMYQVIGSRTGLMGDSIKAGYLDRRCRKGRVDYHQVVFPGGRITWTFFENEFFAESLQKIRDGDEEILEHYKNESQIPKYMIWRDGEKIGVAMPRNSKTQDEVPFLFIPKSRKNNKFSMKGLGVGREYYIFGVNGEYEIDDKAVLSFYQHQGRWI